MLNSEQKALLLFHKYYEKEKIKSSISPLNELTFFGEDAFSYFSRIWKSVDEKNATMVADTSHDFFGELVECHRNICYSVSCANMWGRYRTHHTDYSYYFQGTTVYPVRLNYYDYRYFFYLENAVEEIYTFYERLAYLLFLFLQPLAFMDAPSLSFQRLFQRKVKKEVLTKFPSLVQDINFLWFAGRAKKEHKSLTLYRHPLIHYQTDNNFLKGSYNATLQRLWMKNVTENELELEKLYKNIDSIQKFVNFELSGCKDAFEKMILLIEHLNDINAIT